MMEENDELDPSIPPCLHLISAFLAMEPTECLISLARECGGGMITKGVQSFIWEHCINKAVGKNNAPSDLYVKNFLKKVIIDVESRCDDVLEGLYEQLAYYMTSLKDNSSTEGNTRVWKTISFLLPDGCYELSSFSRSMKVVVPLQCSLNMLEGDTGCSIWPSSLFLSEFILSYPEIFSNKSCFEVGSGVGLVGISLSYAKASKVILSDGDISTLANMKLNLELNQLSSETEMSQETIQCPNSVECKYLQWESALESELQEIRPDIILGADVIYDPLCLPHLIRVLVILLNPNKFDPIQRKGDCGGLLTGNGSTVNDADNDEFHLDQRRASSSCSSSKSTGDDNGLGSGTYGGMESICELGKEGPIAYLATVIRNIETFNSFLSLAHQAHLSVVDITENWKPLNLLPYMQSYDQLSIKLFSVSSN